MNRSSKDVDSNESHKNSPKGLTESEMKQIRESVEKAKKKLASNKTSGKDWHEVI